MEGEPKNYSTATVVITIIVVIIILFLAGLFYYYSAGLAPINVVRVAPENNVLPVAAKAPAAPAAPTVKPTNVIIFYPPTPLPGNQRPGKCFSGSIAAPGRTDAWRCMVGNSIYDPCFSASKAGYVYCQTNTDASTGFLIRLVQPLPAPNVPQLSQAPWAWFLKLANGSFCSPFTGTRPFFAQGQVAFYGCDSSNPNQQVDLLGSLVKDNVWTATAAIITKTGNAWSITSTQQADIDTVWQ